MLIQKQFIFVFLLSNAILIVGSFGTLSYDSYIIIQDLNIRYIGNIMSSFTTVSKVSCSTLCTVDSNCVAFGYNKDLGECEQYNSIESDGTVALPNTGWKMYSNNVNNVNLCTETLLQNVVFPVRFSTTKLQYDAANNACISDGLKLVRIETAVKMEFIRTIINDCSNYQKIGFWVQGSNINATDYYADGAWTFNDGTAMPMSSDFWCSDKPDNPHKEHCVRLNKGGCDHYLNDKECDDTFGYICEP